MTGNQRRSLDPAIHRVRLDKIKIFDVKEDELDALERGSPDSVLLNVAIFTLSTGASFFISLLTTQIESIFTFCVFVIVTIVSFLASVVLLLLWWRCRKQTGSIIAGIREREVVPEGIQVSGETVGS